MKITIEQHGIKSTVEYHDDDIDVYQLGALVYGALLSVRWHETTLNEIFNPEEFDYSFQKSKP